MIDNVNNANVILKDKEILGYQKNTQQYLLDLDPNKFLVNFYNVAGINSLANVESYGGWERSDDANFRGHFFGHYMSALSQSIAEVHDANTQEKLIEKLRQSVDGIVAAQNAYSEKHPESTGYVSAFREVALDEVEGKVVSDAEKENVLVPWYNLHKVLAGLIMTYENLQGIDDKLANDALTAAKLFGEYVYHRVTKLTDKEQMLKTEYGGMNDALYHLFAITKNHDFLVAAQYFDEVTLFKQLSENHDILSGLHANTTIPKLLGAIRRYEIFSNSRESAQENLSRHEIENLDMYYAAAVNFWDIVINHHTYVTGGNSQAEHFHDSDKLYHDAVIEDGGLTCETCNSHNMLKLTRELYRITGDNKYLDYYERTYLNAILGSQNPESGMMTYFQPMASGFLKVYNRPFDEFWCCTGTGIESFTKLTDSYYYHDNLSLVIAMYVANTLTDPSFNLKLDLQANRRNGRVQIKVDRIDETKPFVAKAVKLRVPEWAQSGSAVMVDGNDEIANIMDGFWVIKLSDKPLQIELKLNQNLTLEPAQDNHDYVSFRYGPYVLAGLLPDYKLDDDRPTGILVRSSTPDETVAGTLTTHNDFNDWQNQVTQGTLSESADDYLFTFTMPGVEESIKFVPYYQVYNKRYGIYFQWQQAGSEAAKQRQLELKKLKQFQKSVVDELTNFDENNFEYNK
ncbi:beta-L-arabinofuranosidase domain-containing protein [Lentilactobacillus sp. Marseille-Q4993]|uniref:beta-L-arabinofuranosidase domain-containing protein n=1 Tax=Lentilactobacillus sp. Marseille-Q4993 TaxID=3039492 RepID=UPI0024BC606F|nr:beta-L-arabinofuranosidase domain-containing protein [Lentilactobacillus sp. Marseille-Q4993]